MIRFFNKEKVRPGLLSRGIETRVFFRPLRTQPVYKNSFRGGKYEKAEYFYKHGLLLPSFYELKTGKIKEISRLINVII